MATVSILSPTRKKVIAKLNEIFSFDFNRLKFDIVTYKGSQDADAYRWFTIGLYPQINSCMTMTDFIRTHKVVYDFGHNVDGVLIEEGNKQKKLWEEPKFKSLHSQNLFKGN